MLNNCLSSCCQEGAPYEDGVIRRVSGNMGEQPSGKDVKLLNPLIQEKIVEVMKEEIEETIVEVPQIKYVEKIVEVPQTVIQEKIIHVPKPVIQQRIKEIKKPIYQEKIVEVPQVKVIDKIVEVPQYVYQEKIIEVPKIMVQERIIPVPKKIIKEKILEVPEVNYLNVVPEPIPHEQMTVDEPEPTEETYRPSPDFEPEKVVEVPHVEHSYRNVMTPQYRHIPKPVEVPMTHYRPIPVEKLVDRNVPVPVELQIVQEYLCPKIEPRYKEVPVPVHVQRTIEHPIPKEAMENPQLLPLYYHASESQGMGLCDPGGTCYPCFPFCGNKGPATVQAPGRGGNTVEVMAQQGFPVMHPGAAPPQQQPYNFNAGQPHSTHSIHGDTHSVVSSSHGRYQQSLAQASQHDSAHTGGGIIPGNPMVQVAINPRAGNQPTTVQIVK